MITLHVHVCYVQHVIHTWIDAAHNLSLYQIENSKFCRPDILKKLSEAIDNAQVMPYAYTVHVIVMYDLCVQWSSPNYGLLQHIGL